MTLDEFLLQNESRILLSIEHGEKERFDSALTLDQALDAIAAGPDWDLQQVVASPGDDRPDTRERGSDLDGYGAVDDEP